MNEMCIQNMSGMILIGENQRWTRSISQTSG